MKIIANLILTKMKKNTNISSFIFLFLAFVLFFLFNYVIKFQEKMKI
jgi:hypothetical protein